MLLSDRVFGPTCLTETVYQEGAKEVALSALTGINGNKSMISVSIIIYVYKIEWLISIIFYLFGV